MTDSTELGEHDRKWLLGLARRTLENLKETGSDKPPEDKVVTPPIPEAVLAPSGVFVTLHQQKTLRGCIGYVMPVMPLYRAVIENAVNAARGDPRFPPVSLEEVPTVWIEISVMSPPCAIQSIEEIQVGRDGLIVGSGFSRGLLLPQVAIEYGWDRQTFLTHTCQKAGLPPDAWRKEKTRIEIFSAQVFSEPHH
jgi:AmmeMemoRadiSam system protein A